MLRGSIITNTTAALVVQLVYSLLHLSNTLRYLRFVLEILHQHLFDLLFDSFRIEVTRFNNVWQFTLHVQFIVFFYHFAVKLRYFYTIFAHDN